MKTITETYRVSGQITAADLPALKAAAIQTIICNRPDSETQGNPGHAALRAAAEAAGMAFAYNPITPGALSAENIAAQATAMAQGHCHAYCGSGMRAAMVWAVCNAGALGVEGVLAHTAKAGFDLGAMRPKLEARAAG